MTLTALLHNGCEIGLNVDIIKDCPEVSHKMPIQAFTTKAFACPRCKKSLFALFKEHFRYVCYCLEPACLTADRDASLAKKRGDAPKPKETGAQKFHLGRTFHGAVLSKWIGDDKDKKRIQEWMTNAKPFLLVMGSPGTGKTYLSAAVLNFLHDGGNELAYVTHRRFIEEIHHAMQDGKTQHSVLPRYADKRFLILDDLGSATCTEWQQEMILELIDRRYGDKAKTVITTNFNKDELRLKLGPRTASRLLDSHNEVMEFWSTDRRNNPKFDKEEWWQK
jgi:IstB-like ATP binding protein